MGTQNSQGTAIHIQASINTTINLYYCNFEGNIALGGYSIVYISAKAAVFTLGLDVDVLLDSSRFINNLIGSALHVSHVMLTFQNFVLFQNNSAETGTAIQGRSQRSGRSGFGLTTFYQMCATCCNLCLELTLWLL